MTETQSTTATTEAEFVESFIETLRAYLAAAQPYAPGDPLIAHVGAIVRIAYYAQSRSACRHVEDHATYADGPAARNI